MRRSNIICHFGRFENKPNGNNATKVDFIVDFVELNFAYIDCYCAVYMAASKMHDVELVAALVCLFSFSKAKVGPVLCCFEQNFKWINSRIRQTCIMCMCAHERKWKIPCLALLYIHFLLFLVWLVRAGAYRGLLHLFSTCETQISQPPLKLCVFATLNTQLFGKR